jgi:hypothetical protein
MGVLPTMAGEWRDMKRCRQPRNMKMDAILTARSFAFVASFDSFAA